MPTDHTEEAKRALREKSPYIQSAMMRENIRGKFIRPMIEDFMRKSKISPCFPPESPYHLPNINFLSNAEYSLEDTRYIVSR